MTWFLRQTMGNNASFGPALLIPNFRLTTWKPGLTYNSGIPTGRTQSGSTISPIGQIATFTGTTTAGSKTLTVSAVTGSIAADSLVFDASGTVCFGLIASGAGATWTFTDTAVCTASSVSMVTFGNDQTPINTAIAAALANTFVLLAAGRFNIGGNPVSHKTSNVTLRGTGQWTGTEITTGSFPPASPSVTILWKSDHATSPWGCGPYCGDSNGYINSIDFAADGVKETNTVLLASPYGGSIGDLVLVDQIGNGNPDVFWGNRNDMSGYFTGSTSGTSLTFTSGTNSNVGIDGAFNGTFSGTSLTMNSFPTDGYAGQLGASGTAVGVMIFDSSNTYYGRIVSGTYPNFTLSQSNSSVTKDLVIGGMAPLVGAAIYDGKFSTFIGNVASGTFPNFTLDRSTSTRSGVGMTVGGSTRRFFCRQDRCLSQMMKVSGISGNTVTFEAPFHYTFATAYGAQISNSAVSTYTGIGVEKLTVYWGQGGDNNGNIPMSGCQYSWIQNVQSQYAQGTGVGLSACYRCEVRDSYMHESPDPNPGGGGYLSGMNSGTADCLFENNIMWCGNKTIVMRATGGGNVIGYNYMDDSFGSGYPMAPEAGLNASHFTTPHMELLEGNYTAQFTNEAFWGNSIYITAFRNWATGLRAAANVHTRFSYADLVTNASTAAGNATLHFVSGVPGNLYAGLSVTMPSKYGIIPAGTTVLSTTATTVVMSNNATGAGVANGDTVNFAFDGTLNNYVSIQSGTSYPFIDSWGRSAVAVQAHSFSNNIAGNVFGFSGQTLKSFGSYTQSSFVYENLGTSFPSTGSDFEIYAIGQQQNPDTTVWLPSQAATILRQGNYDFISASQRWHGIGGAVGTGTIASIPNSYYASGKPSFFGSNAWPWVNPNNGLTTVLPAKDKFTTLYSITIPPGNQ